MANTSIVDLNADFVGFGRCDFDVFNLKVFARFPSDGGFTGNWLACCKLSIPAELVDDEYEITFPTVDIVRMKFVANLKQLFRVYT